jgi:hypothetical protein
LCFLTLATPIPEPAGLSLFLPPDPFLLETFSNPTVPFVCSLR